MVTKIARRNKIKTRIRGKISGTAERPRMSVFRSNKGIYVQVIDDLAGVTLAAASSKGGHQDRGRSQGRQRDREESPGEGNHGSCV